MNFDPLKADLNIFIPIHNCCPISVLRDYQNNLNVSHHNGPETGDIFKYTMCINRPTLCIGICEDIPTRNLYAVTQHLLTKRNFLLFNSLKGFPRYLAEISFYSLL